MNSITKYAKGYYVIGFPTHVAGVPFSEIAGFPSKKSAKSYLQRYNLAKCYSEGRDFLVSRIGLPEPEHGLLEKLIMKFMNIPQKTTSTDVGAAIVERNQKKIHSS